MKSQLIGQIPLFSSLPGEEIEHIADTLLPYKFEAGDILFEEGHCDDHFYILLDGQVEIIKALGTPDERLLGVRNKGILLGEMSLFSRDGCHTASVRAVTAVEILRMTREEFNGLLSRQPRLAYEVVGLMSRRLEESENITIADLREKNRQLTLAYEELKSAQAQIIEKEKLEHELQLAYQIQMSILPQNLPSLAGFDFGARIQPARIAGGDFYHILPLHSGQIGIFIGDVADKGMPAAILMAQTHALLFSEANRNQHPAAVLMSVNHLLMEISESPPFVTVLYGVLNRQSGEFHYARAGHEVPILIEPSGHTHLEMHRTGQLLGILDEPVFDEQRLTIPPGGSLLLYTDGVTDSRNPRGETYGMGRLLDVLKRLAGHSADDLCEALFAELIEFKGTAEQEDDITLVVIHTQATVE